MKKIKLKDISERSPEKFSKEETKKELLKLKIRLEELQNLLYAESKHALLVILQGMDASGKDGLIKNVFGAVDPMGCRVYSFKAPTATELKHDFLWRIHQAVPEKGYINIFNRSHYEDVIVQRVHKWIDEQTVFKRFGNINDFEKLLTGTNTSVLKFYLHVSQEEQLKRLKERLSDETKMWKHNEADIKERDKWPEYMQAYEDAFEHCSENADWHIVPSDQNWYKEYYVAKMVVEKLESLKMKYPGLKKAE